MDQELTRATADSVEDAFLLQAFLTGLLIATRGLGLVWLVLVFGFLVFFFLLNFINIVFLFSLLLVNFFNLPPHSAQP